MDETKIVKSSQLDVNGIRRIRDNNSARHSQMTRAEIVAEVRNNAEEIIRKYNLNFTYAQKLQ